MSYLDRPRINFAGTFQASPATVNNTPNNYNPANYNRDTLKPEKIELYWEPKGDSIFNLVNCRVTTAETDAYVSDSLVGAQVSALYTGSPPKLVDLDPMQQNSSEIWGFTLMLGNFNGANVQGLFTPVAFNGIWMNSQGPNTPRSSASGAATYLSTLTNLKWNAVSKSAVLERLHAVSPNRLSIRLSVSAHNCAPQIYAFTDATFAAMSAQGVPPGVLDRIKPLQDYCMNLTSDGQPKDPGDIPTIEYVNYLLAQLLDPGEINQYGPTILSATKQPYYPWINYETGEPMPPDQQSLYSFNYGKIVGSVGPCLDGEPSFAVPARTLAPVPAPKRQTTAEPPPSPPAPPGPSGWWAQAKLDLDLPRPSLTLDLANSLPVRLPGRPPWHEALGTLSLAYVTGSGSNRTYTTIVDSIDYGTPDFFDQKSGMLVVTNFGTVDPSTLLAHPLAVRRTIVENGSPVTYPFLEECSGGWSLRSNQFIYRMNPGLPTTEGFAQGETNTIDFYVRKFGQIEGAEGVKIDLSVLTPSEAAHYTLSTLGTSGTNGISEKDLSTPTDKLTFSANTVEVRGGKATVTMRGANPGNPRGYVDGQVYFTTYDFSDVEDFHQDPNDIISTQIYQENPITGYPTWKNGIEHILKQYGMLYPIMGQFQLWSYQGVVENHDKIQRVLGLDISQPLFMPVTRDLSAIRCKLILDWFNAGMPYEQVGPAGFQGKKSWNNLPEVSTWGPLTGVVLYCREFVGSIAPVYGTRTALAHGVNYGDRVQVSFPPGDPIVTISGVTGTYASTQGVSQLTFTTASNQRFGPYGTLTSPQSFSLSASAGFRINSFFGTIYDTGSIITSIGGNVLPL